MANPLDLLKDRSYLYLDGAMGTMLQKNGLNPGERPDLLSLTHPEIVYKIHKEYLDSGSNVIYANTFGSSRHKLSGTGHTPEEVILASVGIAKAAAQGYPDTFVALDLGPIGEMLEPSGMLTFEEAYESYAEQVKAGVKAGADLIVLETMTDLYEVKAALLAAKENSSLPVFVTMTFEKSRRTFTGCTVPAMAYTLTALGADAIGINCSLGPEEIYPIAEELTRCTPLPVIIKANAGLPDPKTNTYAVTAPLFAAQMERYAALGVRIVGGCCGTTPDYIRELKNTMEKLPPLGSRYLPRGVACTPVKVVGLDGVRIVGERINPTGKKDLKQALMDGDVDYILEMAMDQADAGADILDVNIGIPQIDEPAMMKETVKTLQTMIDLPPLQIDSSDPKALEAGLRVYNGLAVVNSVNGDPAVQSWVLPLVKKYGASVIGLTLDEKGIPETAEERFAIAERILAAALSYGIPKERVIIDCLTLTVSAQQDMAAETLKAVRMVREKLGLKTALGISNISFGLPNRELLNGTFLSLALENGLNLPIINPNAREMTDRIAAFKVLHGIDREARDYLEAFGGAAPSRAADAEGEKDLKAAVKRGLAAEAGALTRELLTREAPLDIVNQYLIPALDEVGDGFEAGTLFLPQLINAANASQEAFTVIKKAIAGENQSPSSVSKGKVILATVKGDIHDIGKNIVKVLLENYGYQVIDLGRDVPPQTVVDTALREDVKLVGLSALMTTTLGSMKETIKALRASGHDCKVMVGGAVLTEDYAAEIGADFYAKDAKQSVDIARKIFG